MPGLCRACQEINEIRNAVRLQSANIYHAATFLPVAFATLTRCPSYCVVVMILDITLDSVSLEWWSKP